MPTEFEIVPDTPDEDHLVLVAIGSPFEGIRIYGPFATYEDAIEWGAAQHEAVWEVVHAEKPTP